MPSEKEIEEAIEWVNSNNGFTVMNQTFGRYDNPIRHLVDAYLSMKSERDKYKAIVETDTEAFGKVEGWLVCEPLCLNEDFVQAVPDILDIVQSALTLREKES